MSKMLQIKDLEDVSQVSFAPGTVLDLSSIQEAGRELCELLDQQGRKKIVIDLGEVRFMSSQALGLLLTLKRKADRLAARIIFANARPEISKLFRITKLEQLFPLVDTIEDAVLAHKTVSGAPA